MFIDASLDYDDRAAINVTLSWIRDYSKMIFFTSFLSPVLIFKK